MPKGLYKILTVLTAVQFWGACSSDKPDNLEPHLETLPATDVTRTGATVSGRCHIVGSSATPRLWFSYGNDETMMFRTDVSMDSEGYVALHLVGLNSGTTYYYMLQGSNGTAVLSGNRQTFTTVPNAVPSVGEAKVLSSSPVCIVVEYRITDDGGDEILESGCYLSCSDDAMVNKRVVQTDNADINGSFRLRFGGLQPNRTYRITPFAGNRNGEALGKTVEFTTTSAVLLGEAGMLSTLVADDVYNYTTISLAGPLNGDDLRTLRLMSGRDADGNATSGKLSDIDLSGAHIVSGGGAYVGSRFSKDNVVGQDLFASCTGLQHIVLPMDAIAIEKDALKDCSALHSVEVAAAVTAVTPSSGCKSLESISVSVANTHFVSNDGVLLSAYGKSIVWFPMGKHGNYTLPSTVEAIDDYAFAGCQIERFVFAEGLMRIGKCAFYGSSVKEVALPGTLRQLPTGTFQKCGSLKIVRIGSGVELLSDYVFDGCPLTDIYITASVPPICTEKTFSTSYMDFTKTCRLHVPKGRKKYYLANRQWSVFENIIEDL